MHSIQIFCSSIIKYFCFKYVYIVFGLFKLSKPESCYQAVNERVHLETFNLPIPIFIYHSFFLFLFLLRTILIYNSFLSVFLYLFIFNPFQSLSITLSFYFCFFLKKCNPNPCYLSFSVCLF